jgi:hypothetical protein
MLRGKKEKQNDKKCFKTKEGRKRWKKYKKQKTQ